MNPISGFLKSILDFIYTYIGNYGWSVVLFTVLVRTVLMPLDIKSRRGQRDMARIQPKVQELQKKYKNDQEKLNRKIQELYRKEHVSLTAGCLPMLIQLPILFCMFTAMRVVANEENVRMLVDWASQFAEGGYDALIAWAQSGAESAEGVLLSWDEITARGLDAYRPAFQNWLWIKNVFQTDSFTAAILPAVSSELKEIGAVSGTYLTEDHIAIAKMFLSSDVYSEVYAMMGGGNFKNISIPIIFSTIHLGIPTSWEALKTCANGLFLLPILAGVSQIFSTMAMSGQQPQTNADPTKNTTGNFMKWFFPIFSVVICATSNAAFSIYWVAVNLLSIAQTAAINWYFDKKDQRTKIENALEEAEEP